MAPIATDDIPSIEKAEVGQAGKASIPVRTSMVDSRKCSAPCMEGVYTFFLLFIQEES